jgi:hypothetical protein
MVLKIQRQFAQQVASLKQSENNIREASRQADTGKKHATYRSLEQASGIKRSLNVADRLTTTAHFQESNARLDSRFDTISKALASMRNACERLVADIRMLKGPGMDKMGAVEPITTANNFIDFMKQALNYQEGGDYIFSGTATNIAPVSDDINTISNLNSDGTANAYYYQGSSEVRSYPISEGRTLEMPILANAQPFVDAFAAANLVKRYKTSHDRNDLARADALAGGAMKAINNVQEAGINTGRNQLKIEGARLLSSGIVLNQEYNDIFAANQVVAVADSMDEETQARLKVDLISSRLRYESEKKRKLDELV